MALDAFFREKNFKVSHMHALHGLLTLRSHCEPTDFVHIVTDCNLSSDVHKKCQVPVSSLRRAGGTSCWVVGAVVCTQNSGVIVAETLA